MPPECEGKPIAGAESGGRQFDTAALRSDRALLEQTLRDIGATVRGSSVACVFHDDKNPSASVYQRDGAWRFHCHVCNLDFDVIALVMHFHREDFVSACRRLGASDYGQRHNSTAKRVVATYDYRDESGALLCQKVRLQPKDFYWRRPGLNGGWVKEIEGVRRVLYRLPELTKADASQLICLVEGEKDADNVAGVGLLATSSPHGGTKGEVRKKWQAEFTETLRGRRVVIILDNDEAGREFANHVAGKLHDVAGDVRILDLLRDWPELPFKGDVSDWLEHNDSQEPTELAARLVTLAEAAPQWTPGDNATEPVEDGGEASPLQPAFVDAPTLCRNNPALREPIIYGVLRRGEVGNLVSAPKMWKSYGLLDLALSVAMGSPWLKFNTRRGRVLLLDFELAAPTLAHRLGAILSERQVFVDEVGERLCTETFRGRRGMNVVTLGKYLECITPGTFDLIIIDPLYRLFPPGFDENSNVAMAHLYAALQDYAEQAGAGIIVVHHTTKGSQAEKEITDLGAGGGSQARCADAHLGLRAHTEPDAAVLAGVLRSWPPFAAFAICWQYPLWTVADDLDPTDLKRPAPRRRPKPERPAVPPEPPWTAERFVAEFIGPEPALKGAILAGAIGAGLSERAALRFLEWAEGRGLVFRRTHPAGRRKLAFATTPEPELEL